MSDNLKVLYYFSYSLLGHSPFFHLHHICIIKQQDGDLSTLEPTYIKEGNTPPREVNLEGLEPTNNRVMGENRNQPNTYGAYVSSICWINLSNMSIFSM